LVVRTIVVSQR